MHNMGSMQMSEPMSHTHFFLCILLYEISYISIFCFNNVKYGLTPYGSCKIIIIVTYFDTRKRFFIITFIKIEIFEISYNKIYMEKLVCDIIGSLICIPPMLCISMFHEIMQNFKMP